MIARLKTGVSPRIYSIVKKAASVYHICETVSLVISRSHTLV